MYAFSRLFGERDRERGEAAEQLSPSCMQEALRPLLDFTSRFYNVPIVVASCAQSSNLNLLARKGFADDTAPRDASFCGCLLESGNELLVSDTLSDARFQAFPAVISDPFIRFYAGFRLRLPGPDPDGVFCIADTKPRRDIGLLELNLLKQVAQAAQDRIRVNRA